MSTDNLLVYTDTYVVSTYVLPGFAPKRGKLPTGFMCGILPSIKFRLWRTIETSSIVGESFMHNIRRLTSRAVLRCCATHIVGMMGPAGATRLWSGPRPASSRPAMPQIFPEAAIMTRGRSSCGQLAGSWPLTSTSGSCSKIICSPASPGSTNSSACHRRACHRRVTRQGPQFSRAPPYNIASYSIRCYRGEGKFEGVRCRGNQWAARPVAKPCMAGRWGHKGGALAHSEF